MNHNLPFDHTAPQRMHKLYCELTGFNLEWSAERLWPWECWCLKFTEEDLRLVVQLIKDKVRMHKPARSMNFRNFISGPSAIPFFEEDLAEAKSRNRAVRVDTDRASVLRSTGRTDTPTSPARTAEQILRESKALSEFLKLKDEL